MYIDIHTCTNYIGSQAARQQAGRFEAKYYTPDITNM